MKNLIIILFISTLLGACQAQSEKTIQSVSNKDNLAATAIEIPASIEPVAKSESEWKSQLSADEYYVLREKGTERSFSGPYWDNKASGIYTCRACDLPLFDSNTKYRSGTGWPSFWQPLEKKVLKEDVDYNIGYKRVEILCARCEGHLGHVFEDGPKPTGLRYCMNGTSLKFVPASEEK